MSARFKVVAGTDEPPPRWWQRPVRRQHIVGGAIMAAGVALGVWQVVDPAMGPVHQGVVQAVLMLALGAVVVHHRMRQPPERPPDQVIVHRHIRGWWV